MTLLNILGSQAVARTQTLIVYVVITILTIFAITTLVNLDPHLLAFSGYPLFREVVSSVALTFFAFLGHHARRARRSSIVRRSFGDADKAMQHRRAQRIRTRTGMPADPAQQVK